MRQSSKRILVGAEKTRDIRRATHARLGLRRILSAHAGELAH